MSDFTANQIEEIISIIDNEFGKHASPQDTVQGIAKGVTQYVGARYVPLFAEPLEWDNTREFDPLTIVLHQGNSYTSRQYVPTGIDIENDKFWALTGNYNAQVEQYRKEVVRYKDIVDGTVVPAVNKNTEDIAAEVARAKDAESAEQTRAEGAEDALGKLIATNTSNIAANKQAIADEKAERMEDTETLTEEDTKIRDSIRNRINDSKAIVPLDNLYVNNLTLTGQQQPTVKNMTYERVDLNSDTYGFILGNENTPTADTSFTKVINSNLVGNKGQRTRSDSNLHNLGLSYLFNHVKTTGTEGDAVGIEIRSPHSMVMGNYIEKDGNTGFSGITLAMDMAMAANNKIKGFAAGIENVSPYSVVSGIQIDGSEYGLYITNCPTTLAQIYSCVICKDVNQGIRIENGAKNIIVSDSIFVGAEDNPILIFERNTSGRVTFVNCLFVNFENTDHQSDNLTFIGCTFYNDTPKKFKSNIAANFESCNFVKTTLGCGIGVSTISNCNFSGCNSILTGTNRYIDLGNDVHVLMNQCTFDVDNEANKIFSLRSSAEFAGYNGNILDGWYLSYNVSDFSTIANNNFFMRYIGKGISFIYDTYLHKTGIGINGATKEITL